MFDKLLLFVCTSLLMVSPFCTVAQCAMCKAANESSLGDADNGFNAAIIFLMSVPYVIGAAAIVAFIVFWRKRKNIQQS